MITLQIDEKIKELALKHCEERLQYEYNRFGFPDEKRKNMILVGTLGQLVFKKYLDEQGIKYDYELQAGRYDNFDFEVNGEIFEIKTSGYVNSFSKLNLLYSADQYYSGLNKGFKFCVQIFVNGLDINRRMIDIENTTSATIAGYIEFVKIAEYKHAKRFYGDDYLIPLFELSDIQALLNVRHD